MRLTSLLALLMTLVLAWPASPLRAQDFPTLTGRVVDNAKLLDEAQEAGLSAKLAALEAQSGRQLVVVTLPDLQGYDIADYGYRLGRHWGIGEQGKNSGALLIVAPNERRVRIEVGYGLEGDLTDALSALIIANAITPRFKAGDYPGGINAGVDEISALINLPPDQRRARAEAAASQPQRHSDPAGVLFIVLGVLFVITLRARRMFRADRRGRRYRAGAAPIILWGPGAGHDGDDDRWGGGWGGGGGFGGFGGGGGSFGGGGASGGW